MIYFGKFICSENSLAYIKSTKQIKFKEMSVLISVCQDRYEDYFLLANINFDLVATIFTE